MYNENIAKKNRKKYTSNYKKYTFFYVPVKFLTVNMFTFLRGGLKLEGFMFIYFEKPVER